MRRIARENTACLLGALLASAGVAYLGLETFFWSDYETEAAPAFAALVHGHVDLFLRLAPAYGGSFVERAPFALVPSLWGGGALAVYRAVAIPCLLAGAVLGAWLVARMRRAGAPRGARALTLVLCVANPITLNALEIGHPEELLGACLCVAAVLLAGADRPVWAAVALGLAVANKEWALLAVAPTLLALAPRRRAACSACATAVAAAVLAPLALVQSGGFVAATRASAAPPATIFHQDQLWWFFGHHAAPGAASSLTAVGGRVAPAWASAISHPLILLVGLAIGIALYLVERRRGAPTSLRTALLALALALLLRCVLDTWDTSYYMLPFLLALLTWQVYAAPTRLPLIAGSATALGSVTLLWLPAHATADVQTLMFLGWTLPLAVALAVLLVASVARPPRRSAAATPVPAQEITVSALSRPLSTSLPASRTTSRSSIRTPSLPGR
jgi:Glycosyltransferase family 87